MNSFFEIVLYTHKNGEGLAPGEPVFFHRTSVKATLLEAPTAFLHDSYVQNKKESPSIHTWAAAAQALKSWLEFLPAIPEFEGQGKELDLWSRATRANRIFYRDCYLSYANESTGDTYLEATISSRMAVIMRFYQWSAARGLYDGDMLTALVKTEVGNMPINSDMLAHTRGGWRRMRDDDRDLPKVSKSQAKIHPITPANLRTLFNVFGPSPIQSKEDKRQIRNRVFADLVVSTGIRLSEATNLTTLQFLNFTFDPADEMGSQKLTIYGGKGKKDRMIVIHNWIITEVLTYINGEREESLKAGKISHRNASKKIFLNNLGHRLAGKPISNGGLQKMFSEACIEAGLVEMVLEKNLETGEIIQIIRASHSIHDLRHTYAVRLCEAEWRDGNTEPWLKVQAQLGHAHVDTTKKCYLKFVNLFSQESSFLDQRLQKDMGA